jgi:thioredoxin-like negative regulator of GroEL
LDAIAAKLAAAEELEAVKQEFRLGRIAGYLNLKTREQAQAIYAKAPARRTERQERALNAAKVALSLILREANAPNQRNGKPRTRRHSHSAAS